MPVYSLTFRNRWVALLLGLVLLGAAGALLVVGIAVLATAAVAGGVLGLAIMAYRKLRGVPAQPLEGPSTRGLDPSLEVFADEELRPEDDAPGRPAPNEEPRRLPRE
jgi:general stress protein CsbA